MSESRASTDRDASIDFDATCPRCGYNVRGLRADARCPECGSPVDLALRDSRLQFSDPRWVGRLARGARWLLAGVLVGIATGVAFTFVGLGNAVILYAAQGLGSLLRCVGIWMLTSPDPSGLGEAPRPTTRRVVRAAVIIGLLGSLVGFFQIVLGSVTAILVFISIVGLAGLAEPFAMLQYLQRVCGRIPDVKLARGARIIRWGLLTASSCQLAFSVILNVIFLRSGGTMPPSIGRGLGNLNCVGVVGSVIFALLYILFLVRIGNLLKREARSARAFLTTTGSPEDHAPVHSLITRSAGQAVHMPARGVEENGAERIG